MELVFLGTSAALPTAHRGLSCTCIKRDSELLVFDAGEGTQMAFVKAHFKWNKPMKIFVTHMHGDHCIGILGMIQTMSLNRRTLRLEIYGPAGIDEFLATNMRTLEVLPAFPITVNVIEGEGPVVKSEKYTIHACKSLHRVESYSYLLEEVQRPGQFHPEIAIALGVEKGQMWHKLQQGNNVTVNGKTIKSLDVMGSPRDGMRIGISGDTRPTVELEKFFAKCDWLVFESTFSHDFHDLALETQHTTAKEAGELASRANVKNLILTHFSARHADSTLLVDEAKQAHNSVLGAHDGLVIDISN